MAILKWISLLFCLLDAISLVYTGGHSAAAANPFADAFGPNDKFVAIVNAILFGLGFVGIQWRLSIRWVFGWIIAGVMSMEFLIGGYSALLHLPKGWIVYAAAVAGGALTIVVWGRWWFKQRDYFSRKISGAA